MLLVRYAIETGLVIATVADVMLMTRPQPRPRMSGSVEIADVAD